MHVFSGSVKEKISSLSNLTIVGLGIALLGFILGLVYKENWAKNTWGIPVLVAVGWSIFQDS